MPEVVTPTKDLLDILVQVLVLVIPIVIVWFLRTYIRSSAAQNSLAAIVRLSNAAIDYVENLDKRGDLMLPPEVKKGGYKLKLAARWLESEIQRAGVKISNDQAEKWISAEFQKRVGDIRPVGAIAEATRAAVDLIQDLERSKMISLPPDVDRDTHLAMLAADWVVAQLAKSGATTSREEALTWVRAELLQRLQTQVSGLPPGDRMAKLAEAAVEFLERLKASGQIAVRPGAPDEDIERDIVTAWLLTEAARQGLTVTSDQIARAAAMALQRRSESAHAAVPAIGPPQQ